MTDLTQIEQAATELTQDDIYEALKQFLHRKGFLHDTLVSVEGWVQSHEDAWKAYAYAKLDYAIHRFVPTKIEHFPEEMMQDPDFPLGNADLEANDEDGNTSTPTQTQAQTSAPSAPVSENSVTEETESSNETDKTSESDETESDPGPEDEDTGDKTNSVEDNPQGE